MQQADIEEAIHFLAKRVFHCGRSVIARRALDSEKIDNRIYQKIVAQSLRQYNNKRDKGSNGGDYYKTAASRNDRRFLKMLAMSVHEGSTLYSDAFRLTNTSRTTFARLLNQIGGADE